MKEECLNCKFYQFSSEVGIGICKRHAPIGIPMEHGSMNNSHVRPEWPYIGQHDWCGDFSASAQAFNRIDPDKDVRQAISKDIDGTKV